MARAHSEVFSRLMRIDDWNSDMGKSMADANVNPTAPNGVYRPLPPIQVEYWPDTQTLHIHNGLGTSDGETVSEGLTGFYDAEGNLAGFLLWCDAETLLKPFLDAVLKKRGIDIDEQDSLSSELLVAQD